MKNEINEIIIKIRTFDDVYNLTKSFSDKQKGDIFEHITYHVGKIHPNFKNITKDIWLYDDIPRDIAAKHKLPSKDKGIDLLLKTVDDEYYPIQCKFRSNEDDTISWKELSTFAGQAYVKDFNKSIYATNIHEIDKEILSSSKIEILQNDFFKNLNQEFFDNVRRCIQKNKIIIKKKTPFDYQTACNEKVQNYYSYKEAMAFGKFLDISEKHRENSKKYTRFLLSDKEHAVGKNEFEQALRSCFNIDSRCHLSMACGTGKSYQMCLIDKEMKNNLTLVLVPSLQLLSQTYAEFAIEYYDKPEVKFILVGSDADTQKYGSIPFLSTKESEIKNKMKVYRNNKTIVISTYQSCQNLKDLTFDFIIFDEAHKTVNGADGTFAFALDNDNIKAKRRLFMTATPKTYYVKDKNDTCIKKKKKKINSKEDEESDCEDDEDVKKYRELGMNNEMIYGPQIFQYQLGDAIDDGRLTQYELSIMEIEDTMLEKFKTNNKNVSYKKIEAGFHYLACAVMIKDMFKSGKIKHLLTYHSDIKYSKSFNDLLKEIMKDDDIHIEHMDGSMSTRNRNKIIDEFKKKKKSIITSAKVLNEGVNIPEVDSVCFVESRSSVIDIVQCVGRCLRIHPGKEKAKILIPVLESELKDSNFGNMTQILKNLGMYDTVIKEFIMSTKDKPVVRKLIGAYGHSENTKILSEIDINELEGKIKEYILEKVYKWDTMYEVAKKFSTENDEYPERQSADKEEAFLAYWSYLQRKYKKKGELPERKIKLLEQLKDWEWDIDLGKFKKMRNKVFNFIVENEKYPVASKDRPDKERSLGNWVADRREQKEKLSNEKIKLLESLPDWKWDTNGDNFREQCVKLLMFMKDNKRYPSTSKKVCRDDKEKSLANFCYNNKGNYGNYIKNKNKNDDDQNDDDQNNNEQKNDEKKRWGKYNMDLLEKMPGWTWGRRKSIMLNLEELVSLNNMTDDDLNKN